MKICGLHSFFYDTCSEDPNKNRHGATRKRAGNGGFCSLLGRWTSGGRPFSADRSGAKTRSAKAGAGIIKRGEGPNPHAGFL